MYKNKKILAFIPARKGSKRIPNKNLVLINGIPLFQYSVDVAKKSKYIDSIIVSTNSKKILKTAHKLGCIENKLRPDNLSTDNSRIIDAILYEIKENNLSQYDVIVLLQPTSPYRTVDILDKAIEKFFEFETSLITVVKAKEHPIFMRKMVNGKLQKVLKETTDIRSQDLYDVFKITGNIYINNIKDLNVKTVLNENEIPFVLDNVFSIDIDTEQDLEEAKKIME